MRQGLLFLFHNPQKGICAFSMHLLKNKAEDQTESGSLYKNALCWVPKAELMTNGNSVAISQLIFQRVAHSSNRLSISLCRPLLFLQT